MINFSLSGPEKNITCIIFRIQLQYHYQNISILIHFKYDMCKPCYNMDVDGQYNTDDRFTVEGGFRPLDESLVMAEINSY